MHLGGRRSTLKPLRPFSDIPTKDDKELIDLNTFNALNYKTGQTLQICKSNIKNKKMWKQTDSNFLADLNKIKEDKNTVFKMKDRYFQQQRSFRQYQQLHYLAKIHQRANILNKTSSQKFEDINQCDRCKCGCERGKGKSLSLLTSQQNLSFLGPGVILQFYLLRSAACFTLLLFILYGVFGMSTNLIGNQAFINNDCQNSQYCRFKLNVSDQNKDKKPIYHLIQDYFGLCLCIVWIFLLRFFKFMGRQKNKMIDSHLKSSSDTAIKISNLPYGSYEEDQLINYIEEQWRNKRMQILSKYSLKDYEHQGLTIEQAINKIKQQNSFKVKDYELQAIKLQKLDLKSIQIIYDVSTIRKLIKQVIKLADQLKGFLKFEENDKTARYVTQRENYLQAKKDLISTYETLQDVRKRFINDCKFRKCLSSTSCLLMFKKQIAQKVYLKNKGVARVGIIKQMKMKIADYFRNDNQKTLFKGKILKIQRAPEPSDIIWQNCQKEQSLMRKFLIFFVSILAICISVSVQLTLEYLHSRFGSQSNRTLLNIAKAGLVMVVNKLIWKTLDKLLDIQYNHTLSEKIVSKMYKAVFLSSVNAIAITMITNYVTGKQIQVYGNDGLAGICFDYQISLIIGNFMKLINVVQIGKSIVLNVRCLRNLVLRYISMKYQPVRQSTQTKSDPCVNEFYEKKQFDIASNYVQLITNFLHLAFFCRLQPILFLINAFATFVFYVVSRINLYRLCKIPAITEYLVFDTALYLLGFFPIVYGIGTIFISLFFQNQGIAILIPSIIAILFGIIALSNPKDFLNKAIYLLMKKLKLDIQLVLGGYDHEDEKNANENQSEQSQFSINSCQSSNGQKQDINQREQSYYANSNVLDVFAFEKKMRGQEPKGLKNQLHYYCQSFFQENRKQSQGNLANILNVVMNEAEKKQQKYQRQQKTKQNRKLKAEKMKQNQKIMEQSGNSLIKRRKINAVKNDHI